MKKFKSFLAEISPGHYDPPKLRNAQKAHKDLIPEGHSVNHTSDISFHVAKGHHAFSSTHTDANGKVHTTMSIHSPDGKVKKVTM